MNDTLFQKSIFGASVGAVITMALYLLFVPPSFLEYLYLLAGVPYFFTPFIGFILGFTISYFLKSSIKAPVWFSVLLVVVSFCLMPFVVDMIVTKALTNIAHTIPTYPEREYLGIDNLSGSTTPEWYGGFPHLHLLYKGNLTTDESHPVSYEKDFLPFYSKKLPELGWKQSGQTFTKNGYTVYLNQTYVLSYTDFDVVKVNITGNNKSVISIIFDQFRFSNTN